MRVYASDSLGNDDNLFYNAIVDDGKCSQHSLSKMWASEAVTGGAKLRSENRQDTDVGGDKKCQMILVQNLVKELSSSTVLEFIHKQTSIASQAYIFPSLPWESYTNGVIVLDCRKDLEQLFGFLDNPNHFVVSSNGRPWVAAEKMSMNDHWTVMLESPEQHAKDEHIAPLLEQISKLEEALYNIQFEQHWIEAQTDRQAIVNERMGRRAIHKAMLESAALTGASILQVYLLRRLFKRKLGTSGV
ncbi:Coated vesicle membrane protein-like [Theobroma cacao]|uniref:Coated vesicle membrane protein-like n=1 Tax=Theobroma cacao TaxID=3641 RepID=A0A061DM91_THECC|nr:Coated vesicle membrane protein-like [Theobroma cacao]